MKKFAFKVDNKLRGAFGETDFDKRTIRINKKKHKEAKKAGKSPYVGLSKKELTLLNTIVHEDMHRKHPRMTEKEVRKKTRAVIERMSTARKQAMYKKLA